MPLATRIAPQDAVRVIGRHMIADGFDVVVDPSGAITINGQPLMPAAPPPPVE